MAERRMFHTNVVESDAFLDLSTGAQALYFHIGMHADDDGFVNGPRQILRKIGVPEKDLTALIDAGFLYRFDGIVVLRHWLFANVLKKDRLKPLRYPELAEKLYIQENRVYTLTPGELSLLDYRNSISQKKAGAKTDRKVRQENLNNINEDNITEDNTADAGDAALSAAAAEKMLQFMYGELGKGVVLLSQEQIRQLLSEIGLDAFDYYVQKLADYILERGAKIKNHYQTIRKWYNQDRLT